MPLRGVNLGGWLVLEKWMTPRRVAMNSGRIAKQDGRMTEAFNYPASFQ